MRDLFDSELITAQTSMPRQPEQMGQNESAGREVVRTGNAMRARARDAGLPCGPGYAILAMQYAADIHNHTYTRTWRGESRGSGAWLKGSKAWLTGRRSDGSIEIICIG